MTCSGKIYIYTYSEERNSTCKNRNSVRIDRRRNFLKIGIELIMQFAPGVSRKVIAKRIS